MQDYSNAKEAEVAEGVTLITGAAGMLGYALCREAVAERGHVVGVDLVDRHCLPGVRGINADLRDLQRLSAIVEDVQPETIIHCAAMTSHAACESAPDAARQLHVEASACLARLAGELGARFVHISTEAVYGVRRTPHRESDMCEPEGVYAVTKLDGEKAVLNAKPSAMVLRATPVGYAPNGSGRTLGEWLIASLMNGETIRGFSDVLFTPIASSQFAQVILELVKTDWSGIFNCGCSDAMSKFEFARDLCLGLGYPRNRVVEAFRLASGVHHGEMDSTRLFGLMKARAPSSESVVQALVAQIIETHSN